jgi:quercetin dioxygenase-like cupin family protein
MLVIRFYQLPGTNVRYRVLEELENLRTKRYEAKGTRAVLSRVIDELRSTKEQVPEQANQGSVVDPFGLGRLLRLVIKESFRGPKKGLGVRDLVDRARELGLKKFATLSQIQALHAGTNKKIHRSDFSDIGKLYDVSPVLFHDFLFPTIQDSVTVRLSDDVRPIPVDSDDDKAREGYRAPCRRLGDTNVAVADIKLAPKSATPFNRHPGYEVLIPRSGNLRLVAAGSPYEIDHEKVVIAHYSSGHDHRIENIGDDDAEALVIRFYQ